MDGIDQKDLFVRSVQILHITFLNPNYHAYLIDLLKHAKEKWNDYIKHECMYMLLEWVTVCRTIALALYS